jgi:6-phosphogluconolactonase
MQTGKTARRFRHTLTWLAALVMAGTLTVPACADEYIVYVGGYTDPPSASQGIYAERFDTATGALRPIGLNPTGLAVKTVNPSYLSGTPDGRTLYAGNWQTSAIAAGGLDTVSAFRIDRKTGALSLLNMVSAGGALPNEVMVDPSGKVLVVANYGAHAQKQHNASVAASRIKADGSLGEPFFTDNHPDEPISKRQTGSHVHGIAFSKDGRHIFIADLGLDRVYTYDFDPAKPGIAPASPAFVHVAAGSGPRRLAVSPDGRFLYCNEQDNSKVTVFRIDHGRLKQIQELSTLPPAFKGRNATAEIVLDRQGRHLYVSNRGSDDIATYQVDPATGMLTRLGNVPAGGKSPRNMAFDPTGAFLFVANQMSGNVVVFRHDPNSGGLTATGRTMTVPQAGGVFFVKAEKR